MFTDSLLRLELLCQKIPALLYAIGEPAFSQIPAPGKWSKKQIIGHLIDSATNNHQRFVRTQFEVLPEIVYDQNQWNACSYYQDMEAEHLIRLWTLYNQHLLELIKRIPADSLKKECMTDSKKTYTLEFLIIDYVKHLEHHLKQIVSY